MVKEAAPGMRQRSADHIMRFLVGLLLSALFLTPAGAQPRPPGYAEAAQAFHGLGPESRIMLQVLLTAAGYWSAVPNENFSLRLFKAIQNFQVANGFPADGAVRVPIVERLIGEARPLLTLWKIELRMHPITKRRLWVPVGLLSMTDRDNEGIVYKDPNTRAMLFHEFFPNTELAHMYQGRLDAMVREGRTIHFKIMKDNFFVISSTTPDGIDSYMRYHRLGGGAYGFYLIWKNASGNVHAERHPDFSVLMG